MTDATALHRLQARIDRLPAGWTILAAGFALQVVLATALLGVASASGDRVDLVVATVLVGVVLVAGVAALPAAVLLWRGRHRRVAAVLAAAVGVGTLVVNEGHPSVWLFPLALFVAAVRAWVRASVDAADLLAVDPDRFERVQPPADDGKE